jgi:hypothetical protein
MAMTLRTDAELENALAALAAAEGASRQEIIVGRCWSATSGHVERVADSADRVIAKWCDVLTRLGSV